MKRCDWNFLLGLLSCVVVVACGTPGAPLPPALELAKPVTDLRATRKGDRVYLAWTVPAQTTDHLTVRHPGPTRVCRSLNVAIGDCKMPAAEIPVARFPVPTIKSKKGAPLPKIEASYTDILPRELQIQNPTAEITYAVSVLNENGRSAGLSNPVQVPSAPTLSPPEQLNAEVRSEGVLLSWACPPAMAGEDSRIGYRLRIYRREPSGRDPGKQTDAEQTGVQQTHARQSAATIGDVNFVDCSQPQFLDQTFEWEKQYDYFAAVETIVSEPGKAEVQVEGNDTPIVQIFAHDIFPPAVPSGLQAVFSGVGQAPFVDLVWSPDTEADLAGYNIFRREEGGQPVKLNSERLKTPAYRDTNVQPGKKYFYSISAVDERDNESARSEETSEQVP
jgi:hypothetical protein